jgi:hypothetical protein
MNDVILKSGWDILLYGVPLVGTLFLGFFRLDQIISAPRQSLPSRHKVIGCDSKGEPLFSDPDGRPWRD